MKILNNNGIISFPALGSNGRLGNQLFQIAATYAYAKDNQMDWAIPEWEYSKYMEGTNRRELEAAKIPEGLVWDVINEPTFHYSPMVLDKAQNIALNGYFQSEKYFSRYAEQIKTLFKFSIETYQAVWNKYSRIHGPNTWVSIHVRRGDYLTSGDAYYQLGMDYYNYCISLFPNCHFLVFSDDPEWCRENFPKNEYFTIIEGNKDILDLALMRTCKHFICSNSTFSWWGAWLGEDEGTRIIFPQEWFGEGLKKQCIAKDIVPDRYEMISAECPVSWPVDLMDVTFTIPVKIDHQDRQENLDLVIRYISKYFNTNILVYKEDNCQNEHIAELDLVCENLKFKIQNTGGAFHRTKLLNDMAHEATTPIIANWDCDVFTRPEQILLAVQQLRDGSADGVYPYDGRFFCLNREHYPELKESLDLRFARQIPFRGHTITSYGGAVLWNKQKFIEGGMENQNFIAYGPEDYERYDRFTKLGYKVSRVPGPLFHMDHWRGNDSNDQNPWFFKNTREYERIKALSKESLQNEIKSWSWTVFNPPSKGATGDVELKSPLGDLGVTLEVSPLVNIIDHFYLVNLERRTDRLCHSREQLADIGIYQYEIFKAVDGLAEGLKSSIERLTSGMLGCFETHKRILTDAIEKGYKSICIFEDDLLPSPGINLFLNKALPLMPPDWQFCYLGCNEYGGFSDFKEKINDYFVIPKAAWGTQAYMVRGTDAMQRLLFHMQDIKMQIDEQLATYILPSSGLKYYSVFPSMVSQDFDNLNSDVQDPKARTRTNLLN